jgi:two-component system, LytTR family, response regulator
MYTPLPQSQQCIQLSVTEGVFDILPADIIRLEASSNYTFIHFTNRRPLLIARVLKEFEHLLGRFGFIRIHRSHLVNKAHISQVDNMGRVVMGDTSRADIARRRKGEVMGVVTQMHLAN